MAVNNEESMRVLVTAVPASSDQRSSRRSSTTAEAVVLDQEAPRVQAAG
jgi:hypothetical protein